MLARTLLWTRVIGKGCLAAEHRRLLATVCAHPALTPALTLMMQYCVMSVDKVSRFGVWGVGCRVWGVGFRVWGLGFGV